VISQAVFNDKLCPAGRGASVSGQTAAIAGAATARAKTMIALAAQTARHT
jgi:hypothetical protein